MRVAIVGAGQIADAHIGEIARMGDAEVVGLCDLFESPLLALKDKYGIPVTGTVLADVLEESAPDVVHITTPPGSHLAVAKECLSRGIHVYVEKPLTMTLAEAEELFELAESTGCKVCLGTNRLFADAQHAAVQKIRSGEIGNVTHIDALFSYDLKGIFGKQVLSNPNHWIAQLPGQLFQNNINHPLATIVPFLSDDFDVRAWGGDWSGNGIVFDELRLEIIDKENSLSAYVVFTSNISPGAFRVSYFGTKKAIFLNINADTIIVDEPARLPGALGNIFGIRNTSRQLGRRFWRRLRQFLFGQRTFFSDMRVLFEEFYRSIKQDIPPPVTYEEALRASRIIEEMVEQIGQPEAAGASEGGRK